MKFSTTTKAHKPRFSIKKDCKTTKTSRLINGYKLVVKVGIGLCAVLAYPAFADIYKTTDDNGVTLFTDKLEKVADKTEDVEKLEKKLISTVPAVNLSNAEINTSAALSKPTPNYKITLTSPQHDAVIHKGNGTLSISASVTPSLRSGDYVEIAIDGNKVGDALATTVDLVELNRGMHVATASVFAKSGKMIDSAKASFYVYQHSVIFDKQRKQRQKAEADRLKKLFGRN